MYSPAGICRFSSSSIQQMCHAWVKLFTLPRLVEPMQSHLTGFETSRLNGKVGLKESKIVKLKEQKQKKSIATWFSAVESHTLLPAPLFAAPATSHRFFLSQTISVLPAFIWRVQIFEHSLRRMRSKMRCSIDFRRLSKQLRRKKNALYGFSIEHLGVNSSECESVRVAHESRWAFVHFHSVCTRSLNSARKWRAEENQSPDKGPKRLPILN